MLQNGSSTIITWSVLISLISLSLDKTPKSQPLYPPRIPSPKPNEKLTIQLRPWNRPPTVATRAWVRNILASLVERTSQGPLSLSQLSSLQVSVSLCSFVVHTQRWGGHRATRPTPDLPDTLKGMESSDPWKQAAPSSWDLPSPFVSDR